MVFNWFRRQFSSQEETKPETQSPVEQEQEAPAETAESEATQESATTVDDDLLNWAKAAYTNIQQQASPEATTPTATESPETTSPEESTVAETEVTTPPVTDEEEPEDTTSTETTATEEATTPETAATEEVAVPTEEISPPEVEAATTETTEAASTPESVPQEDTPTPEAETESTPTAPVPIWARQSAEREARLERLKATAIETPEPVETSPQQETAAVASMAFDEEFVWSSQVLAGQGRSPEEVSAEEISWLKQLRQGLSKTRLSLVNQLKAVVGQGPLNQDAILEIEALLLQADVGVEATDYVIETLQAKMREDILPPEEAIAYLKQILRDLLESPYSKSYEPTFVPEKDTFNIWLMTGVNGAGKTTTIGKLAHLAKKSGYSCLIAAADTFRAAAVEQVKIWGERSGTEVIANPGKNTDPAAVVFDAITAAQARNAELLLVDTAGRLQNKKNLMEELAKIRRIVDKKASDAQVESLLVLDATLGQNGLRQAQVFSEAAKLSGVVLTKLDGSSKGGVALAVVQQLGLPIRFIGAGEGIEDLRPFSSYEFVEALLSG
ncbi:MAG: signal recognition particle-docking protein FtsY [Symploca sp. SIO2D2]|nr:signal recognition particle-docking protein FtsY [Symploca sp. SIO2D2]NEQ71489.1 signal recognition particle-docking protein FtsY [Symploca sp. SIO2D2]